jgi:hypothetical protein
MLRGYSAGASRGQSSTLASESTDYLPLGSPRAGGILLQPGVPAGNGLKVAAQSPLIWRPRVSPRSKACAVSIRGALPPHHQLLLYPRAAGTVEMPGLLIAAAMGGGADDAAWLRGRDVACSWWVSPLGPLPGVRCHRAVTARAQTVGLVRYPLRPRLISGDRAPRARQAAAPGPPAAGMP